MFAISIPTEWKSELVPCIEQIKKELSIKDLEDAKKNRVLEILRLRSWNIYCNTREDNTIQTREMQNCWFHLFGNFTSANNQETSWEFGSIVSSFLRSLTPVIFNIPQISKLTMRKNKKQKPMYVHFQNARPLLF